MKITRSQLKQLIKEEMNRSTTFLLNESSDVLHSMKCAADQQLVPDGYGEPPSDDQYAEWSDAWATHEKLDDAERVEAVEYIAALKADRDNNTYGGRTCPEGVKWLPLGVIWTKDGQVVKRGTGGWS